MSLTEMKILSKELHTQAKGLGIQKFDVFGSKIEDSSVQVNAGKPQQMKSSQRTSLTLRVWDSAGRTGVSSSNDLSVEGLQRSLKMANDACQFSDATHAVGFSPGAKSPLDLPAGSDKEFVGPSMQNLLQDLLECEKSVLEKEPKIVSLPYNALGYRSGERFYLNSEGALRWQPVHSFTCYLYSQTQEEGKRPRSAGVQKVSENYSSLALPDLSNRLVETTRTFLDYKSLASGQKLVVFSADAFLSLLSAFSNIFNAQDVVDKMSLANPEDIGTSLATDLLTLSDNPLHSECMSGDLFDSEGTPTQKTTLLESGKLLGFLHSSSTAKMMGTSPTGNGVLGSKLRVSPHFWEVQRGKTPEKERSLWTEAELIWVDEVKSLHAGVNAVQGSFSLPFSGWVVENGKRISVESGTVAGDFRGLLKSICYVEQEAEVTPEGVCPRVWVQGLSVTGESET